jgi:hypothetical protein
VVTPSASPITYGDSVALTANVSSVAGTPSGSLTFLEASNPLTTVSLDGSGAATFTPGLLTAGSHSFTASYAGGSGFEASDSAPAIISVAPAPLVITADNKTITFGDPLPALTYTPAGFVNGETASVLSGNPQLTTSATTSSPAGTYSITAAAGTLTAANYSFSFVNGTLTINPTTPVVTVVCPTVTYDGNSHACTGVATGVGGASVTGTFNFTYNGNASVPVAAGSYTVSASFTSNDPSYINAAGTGALVIGTATPLVTLNCPAARFNHHRHGCTAAATGIGGAPVAGTLTVTYNGSTTPPLAVGSYAVVATFVSADPNFENAVTTGTLAITRGHGDRDGDDDRDDDGDSRDGDLGHDDDGLWD